MDDSYITIIEINTVDELMPIRDDWNNLLNANETKSIELGFEWAMTWWKHCRPASRLFVLLARDNGKLIGIAPLMITKVKEHDLEVKKLEFIAASTSNYFDFIITEKRDQVLKGFIEYIKEKQDLWDKVNLSYIPATSSAIHLVEKHMPEDLYVHIRHISSCMKVPVKTSWDMFISPKKSVRKNVMNCSNRLKKIGRLSFKHCTEYEEIERYLELFIYYHRKRWGKKGRPSRFENKEEREFIREVSIELWRKNVLDFSVLKLGEEPIAFLYCFDFNKEYLGYLSSFNYMYYCYSPGKILFYHFFKDAFEKGFKDVDLGRGEAKHKFFWTDQKVKLYEVNIFKKNTAVNLRSVNDVKK